MSQIKVPIPSVGGIDYRHNIMKPCRKKCKYHDGLSLPICTHPDQKIYSNISTRVPCIFDYCVYVTDKQKKKSDLIDKLDCV